MSSPKALRLVFSYAEGGQGERDMELVASVAVDMIPPRSHPLGPAPAGAPFFVEFQDADGEILYRRLMAHPVSRLKEVPTGVADEPFHYREMEGSLRTTFSVVVPNIETGRFVELRGTAGTPVDDPVSFGRFDISQSDRGWAPPGVGA